MTRDRQLELAKMLENAAEILRSGNDYEKANTLIRVGDTAHYYGKKWGDELLTRDILATEGANHA